MDKTTSCVVYWLHDKRCICLWRHGYIGISTRYQIRLRRHQRQQRFSQFESTILFRGTLTECRALEFQLRPHFNIGWNTNPGGGKTHGKRISAALKGLVKSPEWRSKIAQGLTGHVRTPESRAKQSANTKGRSKSAEWRSTMSALAKARYADPKERERTQQAVKQAFQTIDRSGAKNSRYGVKLSEATKEKIRQRALERDQSGANNPNYRHGEYVED